MREEPFSISDSFDRPADTTTYAANDLVADNTTAGSVTALSFDLDQRGPHNGFIITSVRLSKDGTGTTADDFIVHLFTADPTVANGDNGIRQLFDVDIIPRCKCPIGDRLAVCSIAKGAQRRNHAFIMAICAKERKLSSPPIFGRFLVWIVPVCAQEGRAAQARFAQRPKVLLAPRAHVAV